MWHARKQSSSTYGIYLYMVSSSDHVTAVTGATVSVTLSKNGGAFGSASGSVSELSNGWYFLAGNATDTNTLGSLAIRATATGADDFAATYTIVPFDPFDATRLGLTALPNANASAAGGLITSGTGTGQLNVSGGRADANTTYLKGSALGAGLAALDAQITANTAQGLGSVGSDYYTYGILVANATQGAFPSAADIDTQLSGTHGSGAWGATTGTGAYTYTVTVTDGTNPLQNAVVSMVEGSNRYTATTNVSGVATFNLDAATYTLAIVKSGYSYAGSSVAVSGAGNTNAAMTAISIPSPASPDQTTAYLYTVDQTGTAVAAVSVRCRMIATPDGTGAAYDGDVTASNSNGAGLWTKGLIKGATYEISAGNFVGVQAAIPTDAGSSYALPNLIRKTS